MCNQIETLPTMELTPQWAASLARTIDAALSGPAVLRDWDQRFLEGVLLRLERGGAATRVSPRQWEQLERILEAADLSASVVEAPNSFPYEDTGGVSHHQKRGWAVNKPKRR